MRKCRIGTAKFFTLLLLLYRTSVNNLRMKHAVQLLEQTDCKVYEIAEKVGFSSLSYFSTAFKKKFGKNPYEYQVSHQRGRQEQG